MPIPPDWLPAFPGMTIKSEYIVNGTSMTVSDTPWPVFREETGQLPDGTKYVIRVPQNWNGILIRDLDFASGLVNPERVNRFRDMAARGYAIIGTARHRLRQWQYDPAREISNHDHLLDLFEATYDTPKCVLQYGCSGGGHLALAISEDFPDRVNGVVALAAHVPVWLMNTFLDGWFVLKVLLTEYYVGAGLGRAGDLVIAELPNDGSAHPTGHGMEGKIPEAWRKAFAAAQVDGLGRARIALAFAIGQWGAWVTDDTLQPSLDETEALQEAMYHSALRLAQSPGGEARIMFENAAQGQQLSWNTDVDYSAFLETANPALRHTVEDLYGKAGGDLAGDLERLAKTRRIAASPHALDFWAAPGRNTVGRPKIPVIRLHMIGDYQIPYTLMLGYMEEVRKNSCEKLVRTALVRSTGHCNFATAESAVAIETMLVRLETGDWPDTKPEALNARAMALDAGDNARFMELCGYEVPRFNRTWVPDESQN